jgi:putative phage-type endonuclease
MIDAATIKEDWVKSRRYFLGGSDAAAVLGRNPYKNNVDVWQEKTGRVEPEDIGYKPYVQYGLQAEQYLTALFALDHPQYHVTANTNYKVITHPLHLFIAGTLDGELVEIATERKGILEVKTTNILQSMQREKWNDKIPENYYIQVLHYLLATGWDFVELKAQLKTVFDNEIRLNTRHYHIERAEVEDDLAYLLEEEIKFWWHVENDKKPALVLPPI